MEQNLDDNDMRARSVLVLQERREREVGQLDQLGTALGVGPRSAVTSDHDHGSGGAFGGASPDTFAGGE